MGGHFTVNGGDPRHNTLVFEDKIFDEGGGELITRKLTITASESSVREA